MTASIRCPLAGESGSLPPSAVGMSTAKPMHRAGNTPASSIHRQPTRHCRQRVSQIFSPLRPPVCATTTTAARLGPKPPSTCSTLAVLDDLPLTSAAPSQNAHDQPKVNPKNSASAVAGLLPHMAWCRRVHTDHVAGSWV